WPLDRPPYHLETSVPGVFVAGDVRAESAKRVASAVGEGAMAVMFVHRYLETLLPGDAGNRWRHHGSDRAMQPRRAAHAVLVREAHRRPAHPPLPGRRRRDLRVWPSLRGRRPRVVPLRADRG